MNDFIKIMGNSGSYTYINLDNITYIHFDKKELKVSFNYAAGCVEIKNIPQEKFNDTIDMVEKELEKRLNNKSEV